MKKLLPAIFFLFIFWGSNAQIFDRFVIGISPTYMVGDKLTNDFGEFYNAHEFTFNFNAAVNIKKYARLGFQNLVIASRSEQVKENHNITGAFLQGAFYPDKKFRIYLEGSYNYGNYCTCGFREPGKVDGLKYIGFGGGLDWKINNWLHLDLGFINYEILNEIENKYNFTQYIIGADFQLFN